MTAFFSIPSILEPELNLILLIISSFVLIGICFRLIVSKNLIESILLMSAFSLIIAICYLFMDAPDVAMTETALGACLSTCVLLNLVKIIGNEGYKSVSKTRIIFAIILTRSSQPANRFIKLGSMANTKMLINVLTEQLLPARPAALRTAMIL